MNFNLCEIDENGKEYMEFIINDQLIRVYRYESIYMALLRIRSEKINKIKSVIT